MVCSFLRLKITNSFLDLKMHVIRQVSIVYSKATVDTLSKILMTHQLTTSFLRTTAIWLTLFLYVKFESCSASSCDLKVYDYTFQFNITHPEKMVLQRAFLGSEMI